MKNAGRKKDYHKVQLAKFADVTLTTLVKIESGVNNNPTIKTLKKIADTLDVSLNELLGRKFDFEEKEK